MKFVAINFVFLSCVAVIVFSGQMTMPFMIVLTSLLASLAVITLTATREKKVAFAADDQKRR